MAKITLEKLAEMTQNEFGQIRAEMATIPRIAQSTGVNGTLQPADR